MSNWRQLLLAAGFCLCASAEAWAIRAYPRPVTVTQPDGTTITVRIHGDEGLHYTATTDGFMLARDTEGFFRYVDYDFSTGQRKLSAMRATNISARLVAEMAYTAKLRSAREIAQDMAARHNLTAKMPAHVLDLQKVRANTAKKRAAGNAESQYLVILVNFADCSFSYTKDDFDAWLNEPGYSTDGGTGSVKDYYRDNSMGAFVPNFTVVGPYTLANEQAYYAANDASTGEDVNPYEMVSEACHMAKEDNPGLDFAQFDNDGDGYMDNCYVIYAGYSEASTANDDDMWPHSDDMASLAFQIDGITIDNYSCSAELVGMPGSPANPTMDGIGTFTHEFGHILGLKDVYDTDDYNNGYGVDPGDYCLYASGSYNNDSRTPPYLMAFERMQLGWATEGTDIIELKEPEDVTLDNISTNTARYINAQPYREEGTGMEWFVLENRQKTGWDTYIPAHGLLIYHYDYTDEMVAARWSINGPNNYATHRCLYIKAADGTDDTNSRAGDTYPGTSANTEFTDTSTPNALNWAREETGVPVTNITESDGLIRFQVAGGTSTWDFVKTEKPAAVADSSATLSATVSSHSQDIVAAGFCLASDHEPTLDDDEAISATPGETFSASVTGLLPGRSYYARAYMTLADGQTVYGSAVQFTTECATATAPFVADFMSWTNGQPDCWQIIDNNADGTTWILDENSEAIVYQFDYWNDADDWLVSKRKIHVPNNGALFFTRGITGTTTVENLEVYVSEKTSNLADFYLLERLSFADYFSEAHMEEIDLSRYAGQDVYIAFRCCSEKLQNNLWLWNIAVTEKLATPEITYFSEPQDDQLRVEWTPVDNALYYYLYFGKETDEDNEQLVFAPMDFYEDVTGDVTLGVGTINFNSTGSVVLRSFPDGITDLKFLVTTSGPFGTSELIAEGSCDGQTWTSIGPRVTLSEYDNEGQECDFLTYVDGQGFTKLRFRFTHGGRDGRVRYLTIGYNDGKVLEDLAEGAVYGTATVIDAIEAGEFKSGTYVAWVASGDGLLFYDESAYARYNHEDYAASIVSERIGDSNVTVSAGKGEVTLTDLEEGSRITCATTAGTVVYSGTASSNRLTFATAGHRGVVIISIDGPQRKLTAKAIVR